jgi:putative ABC transport system permease protein
LEEIWQEIQPEYPFSYTFADEFQNRLYRQEERMSEMICIFAFIAVFTACLGLFGMAAYTVERKKKEIGIRKVLGASERGIVFLLSKEFGKYVLIAYLIASPAAYYLFSGWLESFAYRITIGFDIFLLVTILALLIALVTVSFHAIRAARSNPIKSLERE